MDIPVLERIAAILASPTAVYFILAGWIVAGYYGIWRWNRELTDMTTDRNYWRSKSERLEADLAVRQRQLEDQFMRGLMRSTT